MTEYMSHECGRKCLLELADLLDGQEIPYFLMQGTALGAYRDKGFTPTELDIDFGILQENLTHKAAQLLTVLSQRGYEVESYILPFTVTRTLVAWKYGVKADLVGIARWKDKRFTADPVRKSVLQPSAIVHEAGIMENYDIVEVFGRKFNVPKPIELYLKREYDDWKTPRIDHCSRQRIYGYVRKAGIPLNFLEDNTNYYHK